MSGALVVVATPIGNLGDLSPRALEVLSTAQVVYCEDTRHTRKIFSAKGVPTPRLVSLHEHNELAMCEEVVRRVNDGEVVALVTDAGTPGVSDPGYLVIAAVASANLTVTTTPGVSAAVAALSVAGLPMDRFCVDGFFPRKAGEIETRLGELRHESRTTVFYESPQRIASTLRTLADALGARRVVVARELTKLHEEVVRGTLSELAEHFAGREVLGEITFVLEGASALAPSDDATLRQALRLEFDAGATVRDAASSVAQLTGAPRRHVYELALALQQNLDH